MKRVEEDEMNNTKTNPCDEEMEMLRNRVRAMRNEVDSKIESAYARGMIDGLKFAIRCNGVSGARVK